MNIAATVSNDLFAIEDYLLGESLSKDISFKPTIAQDIIDKVFNDHLNIITPDFKASEYFTPSSYFWFTVYTQYTSQQVMLHDKNNLAIVYEVLDFTHIYQTELNIYTKSNLQTFLGRQRSSLLKKIIYNSLVDNCKTDECKIVLGALNRAKVKIPKSIHQKKILAKQLISNLRTQTGQRDKVHSGLMRYLPYEHFFKHYMDLFKLPIELVALPFLESSFNYHAHSKVGARGIWQIMPYIGRLLFPKHPGVDYRSNQFIATIGALHLLKQNKQILKRWDLAVTAYNSGTKHIVNASRKLNINREDLKLETLFEKYNHPHLGFASINFYSEFLALVKVIDYKNVLFSLPTDDNSTLNSASQVNFYISKCNFILNDWMKKNLNEFYNIHLYSVKNKKFYKGTIVVGYANPSPKFFLKVESSTISSTMPKSWPNLVKNQSCSIK